MVKWRAFLSTYAAEANPAECGVCILNSKSLWDPGRGGAAKAVLYGSGSEAAASNLLGSESKILIPVALETDAMSLPLSAQGSVLALTQSNRKGVEMWENFQNSLTV